MYICVYVHVASCVWRSGTPCGSQFFPSRVVSCQTWRQAPLACWAIWPALLLCSYFAAQYYYIAEWNWVSTFSGVLVSKELLIGTFSCLWQLKVMWVLTDYLFGCLVACVFETISCSPGWPSTHDAANTGPWAPNPPYLYLLSSWITGKC